MKLLLDTHTFIWWDSSSAHLSRKAFAAIGDPANDVWQSAASVWEIQIKVASGKLALHASLESIVARQFATPIQELPIRASHALSLKMLPMIHKDPFDRMLAAQAISEGLTLVSSDAIFANYPVPVLW